MFARIDHVGIAVEDLDSSIELWGQTMQMTLVHREVVEEQGVEAALLDVGEGHVELLAPLSPDTPVGKFLHRRGPGLHHVAYQVADIERTLSALTASGMPLIDQRPRIGIRESKVAFLHPKGTGGVLTEIVQPAHGDHGGARGADASSAADGGAGSGGAAAGSEGHSSTAGASPAGSQTTTARSA